jgi:hypothetical protein
MDILFLMISNKKSTTKMYTSITRFGINHEVVLNSFKPSSICM